VSLIITSFSLSDIPLSLSVSLSLSFHPLHPLSIFLWLVFLSVSLSLCFSLSPCACFFSLLIYPSALPPHPYSSFRSLLFLPLSSHIAISLLSSPLPLPSSISLPLRPSLRPLSDLFLRLYCTVLQFISTFYSLTPLSFPPLYARLFPARRLEKTQLRLRSLGLFECAALIAASAEAKFTGKKKDRADIRTAVLRMVCDAGATAAEVAESLAGYSVRTTEAQVRLMRDRSTAVWPSS